MDSSFFLPTGCYLHPRIVLELFQSHFDLLKRQLPVTCLLPIIPIASLSSFFSGFFASFDA